MKISNTESSKQATFREPAAYRLKVCADPDHTISPQTMARLDYGMFRSLCNLGTSPERICSALNISYDDFDYLLDIPDKPLMA